MAADRVVFCDTDLITNVMWADELYGGVIAPWVREAALVRAPRYALHLWCPPDLSWEPDPQQSIGEPQTLRNAAASACNVLMDCGGPSYGVGLTD